MALRGSHLVALAILAGIGGWMLTGELIVGGQADPDQKSIVEKQEQAKDDVLRVRTLVLQPADRVKTLEVRGRTKADAIVTVRAETGGTVLERKVDKGDRVAAGDLLCVLDGGVRGAQLAQAQAALDQAQEDYDANARLLKRGFATKSRVRQLKAALDAAKANLAAAEQEVGRTEVRAAAAGEVQAPLAEVGDNLSPGGVCVTLIDNDPMLFTGQVPEREIGAVVVGKDAQVTLVTGAAVDGKVRYVSPVADPNTRTFAVEIELPNAEGRVLDGLTAVARMDLDPAQAYRVAPSWLTLADDGQVGMRVVDDAGLVSFLPVRILAQEADGMWVTGPQPGTRIITVGQDYVVAGQKVEAVPDEDAAKLVQLSALEN